MTMYYVKHQGESERSFKYLIEAADGTKSAKEDLYEKCENSKVIDSSLTEKQYLKDPTTMRFRGKDDLDDYFDD